MFDITCRALGPLVALTALLVSINAVAIGLYDQGVGRIDHQVAALQAQIRALNKIDALEEAYRTGRSYTLSEDVVRTRDIAGFDLQLEILRIRLGLGREADLCLSVC
ncbi:hypothetical protein ACQUQP_08875 [Marinobacterium sp. YM272]|uniref:hypothetical protein n=1 Tax=Marinobacterium sp. YM272 TaxID=3421654 RepID=UPI003D7FE06F